MWICRALRHVKMGHVVERFPGMISHFSVQEVGWIHIASHFWISEEFVGHKIGYFWSSIGTMTATLSDLEWT